MTVESIEYSIEHLKLLTTLTCFYSVMLRFSFEHHFVHQRVRKYLNLI